MRPVQIKGENGQALADLAWEAQGWAERSRGWLGKAEVVPGEGLLLRARAIHTLGMRFRLDLAFLDSKGRVLKLCPNLGPGRLAFAPLGVLLAPWLACWALELPAGRLAACAIRPGERLGIQAVKELSGEL